MYDPSKEAANNQDKLKANRRCNDLELARLQSSNNHAFDVISQINSIPYVQLTNIEIVPDTVPNCIGTHVKISLMIYATKDSE